MADSVMEKVLAALDGNGPDSALKVAEEALAAFRAERGGNAEGEVMALAALSECQLKCGDAGEALSVAKDALEIAKRNKYVKGEAWALTAAANASLSKDADAAVGMAQEAIGLFQQVGDRIGTAYALLTVANGETVADKAKEAGRDALAKFRDLNNKRGQAAALLAMMNAESMGLGPEEGLRSANVALRLAKEIGSKKAEVMVLNNIASYNLIKNKPVEVMSVATEALELSRTLKDRRLFANTLTNIFTVFKEYNQPQECVTKAKEGLTLFEELGDKRGQADMYRILAEVQVSSEDWKEALSSAKKALQLSKDLKDRAGVLSALNTVVTVHSNSKPVEPLLMLETAKDGVLYFQKLGDKKGAAAALHLVAAVQYATYTRKDTPREAQRAAATAMTFYRDLGDKDGEVAVLHTMMFQSLAREQPEEAIKAAQDIVSFHQAAGEKKDAAGALDIIANIYLLMEKYSKALRVAQDALTIVRELRDLKAELGIMNTVASIQLVSQDGPAAMKAAEDMLDLYQKLEDKQGEVVAMTMIYKVHLMLGAQQQALQVATETLYAKRDLGDTRGQLPVLEFICSLMMDLGMGTEALPYAREALAITRELELRYSEGSALFMIAKCDIGTREGLGAASEAAEIFRGTGHKRAEAVALHAVSNAYLVQKLGPREALGPASEAMNVYKELGDKQGEAIMLHTIANCQLAMRDVEGAVNSEYEALAMFEETHDDYGRGLALKLLEGAGQTEDDIRERKEQQQYAKFESLERAADEWVETAEEKEERNEQARTLENDQVLWEYSAVPAEWDDPAKYGEKRAGGARRIFCCGQLQDRKLLQKLMDARPNKTSGESPMFANLLNGRFVKMTSLQRAMQASNCDAVVSDLTEINNCGPLESLDLSLRLVQALVYIDDKKVALDVITQSSQNMHHTEGYQEPFHACQWGFSRAARLENPQHEFRTLDIDRRRRIVDMPLISRYLLGSQQTRPAESIIRQGGLFVDRLVGSRTPLKFPVKLEKKRN
jgi:tetratricopeptide (TPR) repeat protein